MSMHVSTLAFWHTLRRWFIHLCYYFLKTHNSPIAMPAFVKSLEDCFGTSDLYEALGVEKTAKDGELRRAYHRLSLKVHPDRVAQDQVQEATQKFQVCTMHVCITVLFQ